MIMRLAAESRAAGKAQRPAGRCVMTRSPRRSYFFFAAFALPDPHEDLLLFAGFFDMHAMAVSPLVPVVRRGLTAVPGDPSRLP